MKKNVLSLALISAMGVSLTGCFGSSEDATTSQGVAVDGLLSGMFCYADINDNAVFDSGSDIPADALTGTDGSYNISGVGVSAATTVCRAEDGAKDQATGEDFSGQLSAPAGSSAVSPITTLIVSLGGDSAAETKAKAILGITADVDLTSNPLENVALAKAATQLQLVVKQITSAIATQSSLTGKANENALVKATYEALATAAESATSSILADTTVLSSAVNVVTATVTGVSAATNADASAIATAIATDTAAIGVAYDALPETADADDFNTTQSSSASESNLSTITTTVTITADDEALGADASEVPATVSGTDTGTDSGTDSGAGTL